MTAESSTYGSVILSNLKNRLGAFTIWPHVEIPLTVYCADIPQTNTVASKQKTVKVLQDIKIFLLSKDVDKAHVEFLDEEIERYEQTNQLITSNDKEEYVDPQIIGKYAALARDEGVVSAHLAFTYKQLNRLSNGVYNINKQIIFYISPEITLSGKIISEYFEHEQDIPVATLAQQKVKKDDFSKPVVFLFGDKIDSKKWVTIKQVKVPFYLYSFITENNKQYVLLTMDRYDIGDYIVQGVTTEVDDFKKLSDTLKIPTKLPYLFAHNIKNKIIKYINHNDFRDKLVKLNITKNNFFDFLFTIPTSKGNKVMKQPNWYKWLIWGFTLHSRQGLTVKYPLHILQIGDPGSGKSTVLNIHHSRTKEINSLFSGSSSTMKDLIPSFKHTPAKHGYLCECIRFAYVDEFFRCVTRSSRNDSMTEDLGLMNDILEHQKRRAGSGVSYANVNMTARIIMTANPIHGTRNVTELLQKFEKSFLSRLLIYYQPRDHVDLVQNVDENKLEINNFMISVDDFVSIIDYLHTFDAIIDDVRLMNIFNAPIPILSAELKDHYFTRHKHHIRCLLDGIVKARCLFDKDVRFEAKDSDYEILEQIWANIIKSWINPENLINIPLSQRHLYLPEDAQWIWNLFQDKKRPIDKHELRELVEAELGYTGYLNNAIILVRSGLVTEREYDYVPHWYGEDKNGI